MRRMELAAPTRPRARRDPPRTCLVASMMAVVCGARSIEDGRGDGLAKGYHRKKRQIDIRSEEDEDKEGKIKEGRGTRHRVVFGRQDPGVEPTKLQAVCQVRTAVALQKLEHFGVATVAPANHRP